MSIVKMPNYRAHWSKRTLLNNGVKGNISRNRFELIEKLYLLDLDNCKIFINK
jgi:hypothetical protein